MINQEKEYRKVFLNHKRIAKHWITPSAHRAHSSTTTLIEPAAKTLDFINLLYDESNTCFMERTNRLIQFYEEENISERLQERMGSGYYADYLRKINKQKAEIENGKEAPIYKIPKS